MSDAEQQPIPAEQNNKQPRLSLLQTFLWLIALFMPTFFLSAIYGAYVSTNENIVDAVAWFNDGDVLSGFGILMALVTLPVVYMATTKQYTPNRAYFLRISKQFDFEVFKPWLMIMLGYLTFWWLVNSLLAVETPEMMQNLVITTDNIFLAILSLCIIAPIFEEIVFRGFLFSRLQYSLLGKSGAVLATSLIFTAIHSQYQGIELITLFTLALLLAMVRLKTNNINYCIAIHMLNNMVSVLFLF